MRLKLRRRNLLLSILLAAAVASYFPMRDLFFAARMLFAVRALAAGDTGGELPVESFTVRRRMGETEVEGIVYRRLRHAPESALMLIAGVSELGCYHPRLVALSRTLAYQGFLVFTPDIRPFRRFEVSREVLHEISFWYGQMPELSGNEKSRQFGVIGISFSGTLALIAAAQPDIGRSVAFVMGIGAYQDLHRCARTWFAAGPVTVGEAYYPTRFYGKWIVMLAALDMLSVKEEREFLRRALTDLLLKGAAPPPLEKLTPEAARWYRLAVMRENEEDRELFESIQRYLDPLFRHLRPDEAAARVSFPVFLAHGAHDDLIPPEESLELHRRVLKARSYLLISPFLTHTHPMDKPLTGMQKVGAISEMIGFFYHLGRAAR